MMSLGNEGKIKTSSEGGKLRMIINRSTLGRKEMMKNETWNIRKETIQ
jgi:hypothetical protein